MFFFYYDTNFITAYLFVFRWSVGIIQQKPCRILHNLWLIPQGIVIIYHNLFKMRNVLWNYMSLLSQFLHSQHIVIFVLIKNHLELYLSRSTATLEKEFRLLQKQVVIDSSMPSELPRKVLDAMRQWYLYQEIWPLCYDNKDITCPKPIVSKPEITIVELFDKTRKCSYCKQMGHEKSRNGKILYPMMPN